MQFFDIHSKCNNGPTKCYYNFLGIHYKCIIVSLECYINVKDTMLLNLKLISFMQFKYNFLGNNSKCIIGAMHCDINIKKAIFLFKFNFFYCNINAIF